MRKCLYVSAHMPSPCANQAGHRVAFSHILELTKSYEVDAVVACRSHETTLAAEMRQAVTTLDVIEVGRVSRVVSVARAVLSIPPYYATRTHSGLLSRVRSALAASRYDCLYCEFPQVAFVGIQIPRSVRPKECVLSIHDSQFLRACRGGFLDRTVLLAWYLHFETRALSAYDRLIVLSDKDKIFLSAICSNNVPISVQPPFYTDYSGAIAIRGDSRPRTAVFWGAMDRQENEDAVVWFVQSVMPSILRRVPDFRFVVVGANPSARVRGLTSVSVRVTGWVDSPLNEFAGASMAILPLRRGSGVKIKTYECLSAGLTVIASPVAAEGVDWSGSSRRLLICGLKDISQTVLQEIGRA